MITVTEHDKAEWARCAQAMYAAGRNPAGHLLSMSAAYPRNAQMDAARFDRVQAIYRAWLVFGEFPQA